MIVSNRAITWALRQPIPPTPKWVLTVLANGANDKDGLTCRRSHSMLALETSLNRRTVIDTVQELIRNGRVERVGVHADGSTIYRVLVAQDHQSQWCTTTRARRKQASGAEPLTRLRLRPTKHVVLFQDFVVGLRRSLVS